MQFDKKLTKHTPGPWTAEWYDNGQWYIEPLGISGNGLRGDSGGSESANAHLIAAAPDLLSDVRNCRALLAHYLETDTVSVNETSTGESLTDESGHPHGWCAVRIPDWKVKQALDWMDASIAKAEGKSGDKEPEF